MINLEQYLLIQLMEECSEIQHACAKALRFGLADGYPGTDRTNKLDIERELADLVGTLQALDKEGVIKIDVPEGEITAKVARIRKYAQISKGLGILE